jgi:hypothetical protein
MPEKKTMERAQAKKRRGAAPSTQAGEFVREEIEHVKEGKHGAKSPAQAIAIGLSKARRAGVKVPPKPKQGRAKTASTRGAAKTSSRGAAKTASARGATKTASARGAAKTTPAGGAAKTASSRGATKSAAPTGGRKSAATRTAANRSQPTRSSSGRARTAAKSRTAR